MRISHVHIANILGITEFDLQAGVFNLIEGQNGSGKTSTLEAIKSCFARSTDATLLRKGADKGEVVLVLDDGMTIRRRYTEKGAYTTVEKDGVREAKPSAVIDALADMLSVNPVDFLMAPPKQRVNVLLESLPTQADPARLAGIAGSEFPLAGDNALEQIASVRDTIFSERTSTNRALKEKESTINQLAATLPVAAEGPAGSESDLEAQLTGVDEAERAEMTRIGDKLTLIRLETDTEIQILQAKIDRLRSDLAETERKAGVQRETKTRVFAEQRAPIRAQLTVLRQSASAAARAAQTRETIKTLRFEADALEHDITRQTRAIEGLDAYKSELLASLPIDGLEVIDGEILRYGVTFDRLNTAQQVEIAVEIAALRAGPLKVVCIDRFEMLDRAHFQAFRDRAFEAGLQLFVTRVADDIAQVRHTPA